MSEEQLERSILERKASEELRAIATAMSLEPVARTRKADLVNQILRAAGVEVDGDSPGHERRSSARHRRPTATATDVRQQHRRTPGRPRKPTQRPHVPGPVRGQAGNRWPCQVRP